MAASDTRFTIRRASAGDADAGAGLAAGLAQSFTFSRARFGLSYPALLAAYDACLLLAVDGQEQLGYLLGFVHLTFHADGPVAWVKEVFVRRQDRGCGAGRALMRLVRAVGGRPGLRADRAGDPAGSALLPRAGLRGVRRLPPQGPGRPSKKVARPAAEDCA